MSDNTSSTNLGSLQLEPQAKMREGKLFDVYIDPEGLYIDIVYRQAANALGTDGELLPDRIYKERYVAYSEGQLGLIDIIEGTHVRQKLIPESISFPS